MISVQYSQVYRERPSTTAKHSNWDPRSSLWRNKAEFLSSSLNLNANTHATDGVLLEEAGMVREGLGNFIQMLHIQQRPGGLYIPTRINQVREGVGDTLSR